MIEKDMKESQGDSSQKSPNWTKDVRETVISDSPILTNGLKRLHTAFVCFVISFAVGYKNLKARGQD